MHDAATGSIFVNDHFVTSGAQARILRKILAAAAHGRFDFERREFTSDETLISSPFDTGFSIRLNRIAARLRDPDCGVAIVKNGRGRFRLLAEGAVELTER